MNTDSLRILKIVLYAVSFAAIFFFGYLADESGSDTGMMLAALGVIIISFVVYRIASRKGEKMTLKRIKLLFYSLFALDIAAAFAVGVFFNLLAGIITGAVLLTLNITVYVIMLKISKIAEKGGKTNAIEC